MTNKKIVIPFLALSFLGFLDATYLAVKHYTGGTITCSFLSGCETVTNSVYSTIGGVPVALLGALYYLFLFVLVALSLDTGKRPLLAIAGKLTILGFAASLYFVYIQAFVLSAFCLYCMVSALTSSTLFVLGIFLAREGNSEIAL